MLPEAKREDLLYVSKVDATGILVYVYAYKSQKQVGVLTDEAYPFGQCVDKKGDVWITDYVNEDIVEYAHGGTTPLKTLNTQEQQPIGCSVSPNGDLAVVTHDRSYTNGVLLIFKNASGAATGYQNAECDLLWVPGYDDKGNVYVEGEEDLSPYSSRVNVCELPATGTSLRTVSFDRPLALGTVMWDGKHITISDVASGRTIIHRARESASGDLTTIGSTHLRDADCTNGFDAVRQLFLVGTANPPANHTLATAVVGGSIWEGCDNHFASWHYPAGGDQKWTLTIDEPIGQSVSLIR